MREAKNPFILFVFLFGIAIRLISITQPYVDRWSWRQSDVAMIAENFYHNGFNILHPQINWAGDVPGYIGTEFPLVPFIASILYPLFGVQEWIGRGVSVLFFAVSAPFLYLIFRKFLTNQASVLGITVYILLPLSIISSRSFMSDTAALAFTIVSLFYFSEWLEHFDDRRLMVASIVTATLAILLKPSSIVIGLPLLFLAHRKLGIKFLINPRLWMFLLITLLFPFLWYLHAYNISVANPPYHMFGERTIGLLSANDYWKVAKRTSASSLTLPITAMALAGVIVSAVRRHTIVFLFWLLAVVTFVIIFGPGNKAHPWYHLPLMPAAAAFSAVALDEIRRLILNRSRFAGIALFIIFLFVYGAQSYRVASKSYKPAAVHFKNLGEQVRSSTSPSDLILVADNGDPTALYYAKRKGWHFLPVFGHGPVSSEEAIHELENLRRQGATHLAFPSSSFWWLKFYKDFAQHLESNYECIRCTDEYAIYDLKRVKFAGISVASASSVLSVF